MEENLKDHLGHVPAEERFWDWEGDEELGIYGVIIVGSIIGVVCSLAGAVFAVKAMVEYFCKIC